MKTPPLLFAGLLLSCALLGGCTSVPSPGRPTGMPYETLTANPPPLRGGSPAVLILSPEFDGGVMAGNVTVVVRVENLPPGTHLVFYRDAVPPTAGGSPAHSAPGSWASSAVPAYTWPGIAPGTHTFAVQLVNADDTPLEPPVLDAVDVTAVPPSQVAVP